MLQQYQHQLLEGMQQYPNDSRTQIRERFQKEYIYLYRHDRKWLLKYLPGRCGETRTNNIIVDWSARDADYCAKIKQLHNELMALKKPVRITNSLIGKRLGILSNLEKHLSKLPKTKKLLGNITESVPQFQIRRCCKVIDQMLQKKEPVLLWKVQRIGAVKSHHFHEIKPHLEAYIHMKRKWIIMDAQQVKIMWPFVKGEKARLIWIGDPFRYDNKVMLHAYFQSRGVTKKVLLDWGTLPCLAIQHYYSDGVITTSQPPEGAQEVDITIYPNNPRYYERPWKIQGNNDPATSRSFIFNNYGKTVILPVIEVLRSILAPNGFLLYRLFESNSFPQFFTETYAPNKIHLSFHPCMNLNILKGHSFINWFGY